MGPRDEAINSTTLAALRFSLLDFLDRQTLQEMQDSFVTLTGLNVMIRDENGQPLTSPTDLARRRASDELLARLLAPAEVTGDRTAAPIMLEGESLGSITVEPTPSDDSEPILPAVNAAAIQFLQLLATGIARLCAQELHLMQRVEELTALYRLSRVVAAHRDLQQILDTAAREAASVMNVTAVSIRLIDEKTQKLVPRAAYNLSEAYLKASQTMLEPDCTLFKEAMSGKVVTIADLRDDPCVTNPEAARREGLVSLLCVGLVYQGRPLGVLQLFTAERYTFSKFEIDLTKAMARLLAAAIESSHLDEERQHHRATQRQLEMAADVQRRMLPGSMPNFPPFDIAARYVPTLELCGDFYDFIGLEGHLGVAIGDVMGKGVAASLLMASVRASLRAYAQDVYDIDEIIARVNTAMVRDTLDSEFATLFYGVLDPHRLRMTYCNAGHNPPMILRNNEILYLTTGGMVVGIDPHQTYQKGIVDLQPGDVILLHTDGLADAMNFAGERFGKQRVEQALRDTVHMDARSAANHILWQMRRFTGLNKASDDTTLVVIRVNPV